MLHEKHILFCLLGFSELFSWFLFTFSITRMVLWPNFFFLPCCEFVYFGSWKWSSTSWQIIGQDEDIPLATCVIYLHTWADKSKHLLACHGFHRKTELIQFCGKVLQYLSSIYVSKVNFLAFEAGETCELEPSSDLCRTDYPVHLPVCCWRYAGPGSSGEKCGIRRRYHITNRTVDRWVMCVCVGGGVVVAWAERETAGVSLCCSRLLLCCPPVGSLMAVIYLMINWKSTLSLIFNLLCFHITVWAFWHHWPTRSHICFWSSSCSFLLLFAAGEWLQYSISPTELIAVSLGGEH